MFLPVAVPVGIISGVVRSLGIVTQPTCLQVVRSLLVLGAPLAVSYALQCSLRLITLSYVGTLGDLEVAAAGMGIEVVFGQALTF